MKAVKANKVYTIDESQQRGYQDAGFDIVGDGGRVIAYGRGKTVPYEEHVRAVREIKRLQSLAAGLNKQAGISGNADDERVIKILSIYAEEHRIDLGRASSVSGIVKKIEDQAGEALNGPEKVGE